MSQQLDDLISTLERQLHTPDVHVVKTRAARAKTRRQQIRLIATAIAVVAIGVVALALRDRPGEATADGRSITETANLSEPGPATTPETAPALSSMSEADLERWIRSNADRDAGSRSVELQVAAGGGDYSAGVRVRIVALPLEDGFEFWTLFFAPCGPMVGAGMLEPSADAARFYNGRRPEGSEVSFQDIGYDCTPTRPGQLFRQLSTEFRISEIEGGLQLDTATSTISLLLPDAVPTPTTSAPAGDEESTPTSGIPNGSMADVLLLASPADVFFTPTWEPLARRYAEQCDWTLAGATTAPAPYGDTTIAADTELVLEAIDCEGGLVARTDNTILVGELSEAARQRVDSISTLVDTDLFIETQ